MRIAFIVSIILSIYFILGSYHPELITGPDITGRGPGGDTGTLVNVFNFTSLLCGIVVFVFYWVKFSRWPGAGGAPPGFFPKPTRHFTTWLRYVAWSFFYAGFMVACFYFIIFFPQTVLFGAGIILDLGQSSTLLGAADPSLLRQFFQALTTSLEQNPDAIVIYALIGVTLIWAGAFGDYERRFRQVLQNSALIPTEAEHIVEYFTENAETFDPKDKYIDRVVKKLSADFINKDDFLLNDGSLSNVYAQCEFLIAQLQRLRHRRFFKKIYHMYNPDYIQLKENISEISKQIREYRNELVDFLNDLLESTLNRQDKEQPDENIKNAIDRLKNNPNLAQIEEIWTQYKGRRPYADMYFTQIRQKTENDLAACLHNTLQVIVCGIFATAKSPAQRKKSFKEVGLISQEPSKLRINRDLLTNASVTIVAVTFISSLTFFLIVNLFRFKEISQGMATKASVPMPESFDQVLTWSIYALLMHVIGMIAGFLMYNYRWYSRSEDGTSDAGRSVVPDVLECALFGFSLNILFFVLITAPWGRWYSFQLGWLWAAVPAVTAGFTGYYLYKGCKKVKWPMIISQGMATSLFALFTLVWRYSSLITTQIDKDLLTLVAVYITFCLVTTCVIGVCLSWVTQKWVCDYVPTH